MSAIEDQRKIAKQIVDLQESVVGREWTSEEHEKFDRLVDAKDALNDAVESEEKRAAALAEARDLLAQEQEVLDDVKPFGAPRESAEAKEEKRKVIFEKALRAQTYGEVRELEKEARAFGTQVVGTSGYGGILVPTEFQAQLLVGKQAYGGMMRAGPTVINTARGGTIRYPIIDDVANKGKYLSEATAASTSKRVDFNTFQLYDFKWTSGPIKISREMKQDGLLDVQGIVRDAISVRLGRFTEDEFANSTAGSTDVSGIYATCSTNRGYSFAKGSSNLKPNEVIELIHTLDPAWRQNAKFMCHDNVLKRLRLLREWTSTGGYEGAFIWQPSFQQGVPDRLAGYPIITNNSMSTSKFGMGSSDNYPLLFGDWGAAYYVRQVLPLTVRVLEERYADEDVSGILAFYRFDGRPASTTLTKYPLVALNTT